jgi:hypothetical protein
MVCIQFFSNHFFTAEMQRRGGFIFFALCVLYGRNELECHKWFNFSVSVIQGEKTFDRVGEFVVDWEQIKSISRLGKL